MKVSTAAATDYGYWKKIELPHDTIYLWWCGCCPLEVHTTEPEVKSEWIEEAPPK